MKKFKAYIIGKSGSYRNPHLLKQVNQLFDVVETDGFVDSKNIDLANRLDTRMCEAVIYRLPIATEVACFQAHINAWEWLAQSNEDFLAVFEDDARLFDDSVSKWAQVASSISALRGNWVLSLERRVRENSIFHKFPWVLPFRRTRIQPYGTTGYIISRSAALSAIGELIGNSSIDGVADTSPTLQSLFKFYTCVPPLVEFIPGVESHIWIKKSERKFQSQKPKLHKIRFIGRILLDPTYPTKRKLALIKVRVLRNPKYYLSVHFLTSWLTKRIGAKNERK